MVEIFAGLPRPELVHSHWAIRKQPSSSGTSASMQACTESGRHGAYYIPPEQRGRQTLQLQEWTRQAEGVRAGVWACLEHTASVQRGLWKGDHLVRSGMQGCQHVIRSEHPCLSSLPHYWVIVQLLGWQPEPLPSSVPPAPSTGKV